MSVNPLSSFSNFNLGKFLGDKPRFLDIVTKANEILSPTGLLQRVVGRALGTQNAARITDFLQQSGLSLSALPQPLQSKNGENIFRFPASEKFWHSIGTFQQTGNALPLHTGSLSDFASARTPSFAANPNNALATKHGIALQTQRTRLTPTDTQDKPAQYQIGKLTSRNGTVYDGDSSKVADDERFGILVDKIGKDDAPETILFKAYEATAKAAGYSEAAAARIAGGLVNEQKQLEQNTGQESATTFNPETQRPSSKTHLDNVRASGQLSFNVTGANLKHLEEVNQQQLNQQEVTNELVAGKLPSNELLQKAGLDRDKLDAVLKDVGWQPVPTFDEAVDKLGAQKKADVLTWRAKAMSSAAVDTNFANSKWYGMTDAQITAETHREAEVEIKRQVGKGELTLRREDRPDSIGASDIPKWQTDAKLLIEKYLPGVAALNTPEGIKTTGIEAFTAAFVNARLFGATEFYVDQSRFHNEQERGNAQLMSVAGSTIGELQNLTLAGKTVEAAMATTKVARGVQILRESGTAGKLIAQALPSAVTFGGLQTAKETVKAATGNSEGTRQAVTNIVRETTVGAVFGVFEPLKVGMRVPAVVAGSYGVEKVFGATDKEAAMSALTNGLFAIAGGRSERAAEELAGKTIRITGENGTTTNVKVTVDAGRRIVLTEVAANVKADLQIKASQLKAAAQEVSANWGKANRIFTREQYDAAKTDLTRYGKDYKGTINGQWQPFPAQAFDPRIQAALTKIGGHHLEAGIRSFPEFVRKVRAEAEGAGMNWQTTRPYLERAYKDGLTAIKAEKEADIKGLQTYNQAMRAQDLNKTIGVTSAQEIIGTDAATRAEFRQKINDADHPVYLKHVKARTDTEAQKLSSSGKEPAAQYLPELKGKIKDLETKAIWRAVDRGMVFKDGEKFYFFHKFDQPIGYNNGKLTQWIRVEWSSGNIHGHPTNLETVRKNFPNVKE